MWTPSVLLMQGIPGDVVQKVTGAAGVGDDGPEGLVPEGKVGGVDGTRTPSVSEEKRERFTPSSEAPLVTRDLFSTVRPRR
jgi:hypothetical protein